jgi:hypothetical protein
MTLKGLLIGNSHLAALKLAYDQSPGRWSGLSLDFFGARSRGLNDLEVRNGVLCTADRQLRRRLRAVNGRHDVALAPFDFVAIVGAGMSIIHALRIYRSFRVLGMPSLAALTSAEDLRHDLISKDAALTTIRDQLASSMGIRLAERIQRNTDLPIWLIEQPHPSRNCLTSADTFFAPFGQALKNGDAPMLAALHDKAFREATGKDRHPLPQPQAAICDGILLRPELSLGAIRLTGGSNVPHPVDDVLHANADFGSMVLDDLAARVSGHFSAKVT